MMILDGLYWENRTRMVRITFRKDRTSPGQCG